MKHTDGTIDRTIDRSEAVSALQGRAAHLRRQARQMHPLVGKAYRRRAAELELGAWALAIRCGRSPAESRTAAA